MRKTFIKLLAFITAIILALCCAVPVFAENTASDEPIGNQGVEGDVLNVLQPEDLEIQLGKDFAYHGFILELDYGTYPDTIYADENGVLKLEIGGSKSYVIKHTGDIKDTTEETTWHIPVDSAEVTNGDDGAAPSETVTEAITESKPVNDSSASKFPVGAIIVIAVLVVLCVIAIILERKSAAKNSKKKRG